MNSEWKCAIAARVAPELPQALPRDNPRMKKSNNINNNNIYNSNSNNTQNVDSSSKTT